MKITNAEFIISAIGPAQYPDDGLPEIGLAGRSNVGKSSLINKMIMRKNLARTSSQPGKTQQLNYYRINDNMYFVDVPGYGYAKVSKAQRAAWGKMIEAYFRERDALRLVLLVVDLRHPPTEDDAMMHQWLVHYEVPVVVVATKADKVAKSRWPTHVKQVRATLGLHADIPLVLFSAETGQGRQELWNIILAHQSSGETEQDALQSDE
jgi:GTP-binding protein